jgi:hypothetical protein
LVQRTIAQERRRVRGWGWAAVILWLIVGAHSILTRLATLLVMGGILPQRLHEGLGYANAFAMVSGILSLTWPMLLCAAALCTVKFILVSRQATLRQIRAELAAISEEVRRLGGNAKR